MDMEVCGREVTKASGRMTRILELTLGADSGLEVRVIQHLLSPERMKEAVEQIVTEDKGLANELVKLSEVICAFPEDLKQMDTPAATARIARAIAALRQANQERTLAERYETTALMPEDVEYLRSTRNLSPKTKAEAQFHVNKLRDIAARMAPHGSLGRQREYLSRMTDLLQVVTDAMPEDNPATFN